MSKKAKVELTKGDSKNISAKDTSAASAYDEVKPKKAEPKQTPVKPEKPELEAIKDPKKDMNMDEKEEIQEEEEKNPDEPYDPLKNMTKEERAMHFKAKADVLKEFPEFG